MGDPAGVGPELCVRLLGNPEVARYCCPIVFGDAAILQHVARQIRCPQVLVGCQVLSAANFAHSHALIAAPAIVDLGAISARDVQAGRVSADTGQASYAYIVASIDAAMAGHVDAVTTGPIHKEAIHAAGVPYPGHTEIYAARTGADRACMMLTSRELTCSFVTTHVGYRDVPSLLNQRRIHEVIRLSHEAMLRIRGTTPKLIVCGLNPHAGEHGLFGGGEEEQHIIPAIEQARSEGLNVDGPLPPDTAFLPARRKQTDCFVCMYHDQGHIPLKALAFDLAVNITLGLPIIRTSVDHGTALDIAWKGVAQVTSLIEAVELATKLAKPAFAAQPATST
jgi:4-hydroxythreonine-4-phosphate dehydrogenase